MRKKTLVLVIGPLSGVSEIEIENMYSHHSQLLAENGIAAINLWEHLEKQKPKMHSLKQPKDSPLTPAGWAYHAFMVYMSTALVYSNAIYIIPDATLCLAARTLVALAYGMGHEILEKSDGEFMFSAMDEGEVNNLFADPLVRLCDRETNESIGGRGNEEEGDDEEQEQEDYTAVNNAGGLLDDLSGSGNRDENGSRLNTGQPSKYDNEGKWAEKQWGGNPPKL